MNRSILSVGVALTLSAVSFAQEMGNYTFINKSNKPHQFTLYTPREAESDGVVLYSASVNVPASKNGKLAKTSGVIPLNTDDFYATYIVQHLTHPVGPRHTVHSGAELKQDHYNLECEVSEKHITTCKTR